MIFNIWRKVNSFTPIGNPMTNESPPYKTPVCHVFPVFHEKHLLYIYIILVYFFMTNDTTILLLLLLLLLLNPFVIFVCHPFVTVINETTKKGVFLEGNPSNSFVIRFSRQKRKKHHFFGLSIWRKVNSYTHSYKGAKTPPKLLMYMESEIVHFTKKLRGLRGVWLTNGNHILTNGKINKLTKMMKGNSKTPFPYLLRVVRVVRFATLRFCMLIFGGYLWKKGVIFARL